MDEMNASVTWDSFHTETNNNTSPFESSYYPDEIYSCYICGLYFVSLEFLKLHIDAHDYNTPPIVSIYKTKIQNIGIETTSGTATTSNICDELELAKEDQGPLPTQPHPDPIKTVQGRFPCDQCPGTYAQKHRLNQHTRDTHSNQNPYLCNYCLKSFPTESSLDDHIRLICYNILVENKTPVKKMIRVRVQRTPEPPKKQFGCDKCGKRFKEEWFLKVHERSQCRDSNFFCDVCHSCFATIWRLRLHFERTQKVGLTIKCELCSDQGFRSKAQLNAHLLFHSKTHEYYKTHVCEHCSKCFTSNSVLRQHVSKKELRRPSPCSFCGVGFMYRCALAAHLQEHGEYELNQQKSEEPNSVQVTPLQYYTQK